MHGVDGAVQCSLRKSSENISLVGNYNKDTFVKHECNIIGAEKQLNEMNVLRMISSLQLQWGKEKATIPQVSRPRSYWDGVRTSVKEGKTERKRESDRLLTLAQILEAEKARQKGRDYENGSRVRDNKRFVRKTFGRWKRAGGSNACGLGKEF